MSQLSSIAEPLSFVNDTRVKVILSSGQGQFDVNLARVPNAGEYISIADSTYVVKKVEHIADSTQIAARVWVNQALQQT